MLIIRADHQFLLGFPLAGKRVKRHFHLELRVCSLDEEVMSNESLRMLDKDEQLGIDIREDLMRHFDEIWENHASPWVPRRDIFREILGLPLVDLEYKSSFFKIDSFQSGKVGDFVLCLCSPDKIQTCYSVDQNNLPSARDEVKEFLRLSFEKALHGSPHLQALLKKYQLSDEQTKGMASNFAQIVEFAFKASTESLKNSDKESRLKIFGEKLTEEFSRGISNNEFEFEDLAEAVHLVKELLSKNDNVRIAWISAWETIEKAAEHWAR